MPNKLFNLWNVSLTRRRYDLNGIMVQNDASTLNQSLTARGRSNLFATDAMTLEAADSAPGDTMFPGYVLRTETKRIDGTGPNLSDSFINALVTEANFVASPNYRYTITRNSLNQSLSPQLRVGEDDTEIRLSQPLVYDTRFSNFGLESLSYGTYEFVAYHGYGSGTQTRVVRETFQLRAIELTHFGMTVPAVDLNVPEPKVDIKGSITVYPNQAHTGIPGWTPSAGVVDYRVRIGHPDLDPADWIQLPDGVATTTSPDEDGVIASFLETDIDLTPLIDAFAAMTPPRPLPDILQVEGRAIMDTEDGSNTVTPLAVAYIVDDDRELRKDECDPPGSCNAYGLVAMEAATSVAGAIDAAISIIGNNTEDGPQSMGYGWQASAYKRCEEDASGHITFHDGAGQIERWIKNGINYVAAHPDNYTKATKDANQNIVLTFLDKSVMRFEQTGPDNTKQRLVESRDPDGNKLTYTYESDSGSIEGRLNMVADDFGRSTTFGYTGSSRQPSTITTHGGRTTSLTYHPSGQLATMTDPGGYTTSYLYEDGYLSRVTDPVGIAIAYTYSQDPLHPGRVESETYYGQMRRTYDFDDDGKTFTVIETDLSADAPSASRTTVSEFDEFRNIVKKTDPLGNETLYEYNDRYNPYLATSVTNPNGTTRYSYNSKGFVTSVTDVNGLTTSMSYGRPDLPHLVTAVTRPAGGGTTKMTYSSSGNLTAIEDALGNSTLMGYDDKGYLESVQDRNGHITEYEYGDSHKNLTVVKAPGENSGTRTITMTYDNHDNVESVTVGSQTVSMKYDGLDRVYESLDALSNVTAFDFSDITGLLDAVDFTPGPGMTGPAKKTEMLYDSSGRMQEVLRQVETGFQSRVKYKYDGFSQLRELTRKKHSGADKAFKFTYDQLGRPKTSTDTGVEENSAGRQSRMDYAPFCSERSSTSARGVRTVSNFNNLCQLIGVEVGTPGDTDLELDEVRESRSFLYDPLGRLKSSTQPPKNFTQNQSLYGSAKYGEGTYSSSSGDMDGPTRVYDYDVLDRLTSVTFEDGKTALFEHFPEGQLKQVTDPEDKITKYTYHPSNALESVTVNRNGVDVGTFDYNYDSVGMLESIEYPAETGITAEFSSELGARGWDANGRLIHLRYVKAGMATPLRSFEFSYDAAGNRTGQIDRSPSGEVHWTYNYDYLDRLSRVSKGTSAANVQEVSVYAYDESDNRTVLELPQDLVKYIYSYDESDAVKTREQRHYSTNALIFSEAFTSDDDGNLLTRTRSDTGITLRYGWDDFNKLISVSSVDANDNPTNDARQENSYNANGFRRKKKAKSGAVTTEYSTGLETAVARGAGDPISYIQGHHILGYEQGGSFYWFLSDALGSVRDIVSGTDGAVLQSYDYKENGEKTTADPSGPQSQKTWVGGLSVNDDVGDSGLYLMGHRHYDPSLGRFLSQDPIGFAGGLNLYEYAANSPAQMVDPRGLWREQHAVFGNPEGSGYGMDPASYYIVDGPYRRLPTISVEEEPAPPLMDPNFVIALENFADYWGLDRKKVVAGGAAMTILGAGLSYRGGGRGGGRRGGQRGFAQLSSGGGSSPCPDQGGSISVYHGSINDSSRIRANGLDPGKAPTWVSRDRAAAADAIGRRRYEVQQGMARDPGIVESKIPASQFAALAASERAYGGFHGSSLNSTEIVLRTLEQFNIFNANIVR